MKNSKTILSILTAGLALAACDNSTDDNRSLDYTELQVNLAGTAGEAPLPAGTRIGVFAACSRHDTDQQTLATNVPYTASGKGHMIPDDGATITTLRADHAWQLLAYYPYDPDYTDPTAIPASAPAMQTVDGSDNVTGLYVAADRVTTVIPTVQMKFANIFASLRLDIASDILDIDGGSVIRSVTVEAADPSAFDSYLAVAGTYNLTDGTFTPDLSTASRRITVDLGAEGRRITASSMPVDISVSPFTVPAGGLNITVTAPDGTSRTSTVMSTGKYVGQRLEAGQQYSVAVSGFEDDGIEPVTFPLTWPVGKRDGKQAFTAATQPRWLSEGYWTASQPQAYIQWTKVSDPLDDTKQYFEIVNVNDISSPGVKGVWTGDYYELVIPVRRFKAGTTLSLSFPMYGRQHPVFYDIEYLDGNEWKCNRTELTSYDGQFKRDCTFAAGYHTTIVRHSMTFANAVNSGIIRMRVKVADGSIVAKDEKNCVTTAAPWKTGNIYGAPFYFYDRAGLMWAITVEMN